MLSFYFLYFWLGLKQLLQYMIGLRPTIIYLISFILTAGTSSIHAQQTLNFEKEAVLFNTSLSKNHYNPKALDKSLSMATCRTLLEKLDPSNIYFLQSDYLELLELSSSMQSDFTGKSWNFFPKVASVYKLRLEECDKMLALLKPETIRVTAGETINLSSTHQYLYAKDAAERLAKWKKRLMYHAILRQLEEDGNTTPKLTLTDALATVIKVEKRKIARCLNSPAGYENALFSDYLNAFSSVFDPHSSYYTAADWVNFQSLLTNQSYSFGFDVEMGDQGDIEISRIAPGGAAWNSNELNKKDILLSLQWQNNSIDLQGASLQEVYELLFSGNQDAVTFTVKKPDGKVKKIQLKKEQLNDHENVVKSFVLNGTVKVGYISLPGFYSELENIRGLGCANDVAKEVVKLKSEGVQGLILDIRNNGGGSVMEGLNLAGLFINEGPLFMLQSKTAKPQIIKDMNRGTVYDGPLVVMVNGHSASASELVAAALQDYNRAVIVGTPTFGKATGQIILPVDTSVNKEGFFAGINPPPCGVIKVTTEKIYRVSGKSAQLGGVLPDIYLPDLSEYSEKELDKEYALAQDSVMKKAYYYPSTPLPVKKLRESSEQRLAKDSYYQLVYSLNQKISEDRKKQSLTVPLTEKGVSDLIKEYDILIDSMEASDEFFVPGYEVNNNELDREILSIDAYANDINSYTVEEIKKDRYISEAYNILQELIPPIKK